MAKDRASRANLASHSHRNEAWVQRPTFVMMMTMVVVVMVMMVEVIMMKMVLMVEVL